MEKVTSNWRLVINISPLNRFGLQTVSSVLLSSNRVTFGFFLPERLILADTCSSRFEEILLYSFE